MCGLFGACGDLISSDKDLIKLLALFNTTRGEDSTGICVVSPNPNDDPVITKVVGNPYNLFETSYFERLSLFNKRAVIGHTRKATVGSVSKKTAHPFNFGDIYGVHNGTLRNWRQLPGPLEDIDSQMLYRNIAEHGLRDTIEQVDGAYALVFWDNNERVLNFLRNSERTLYYCLSEDGKRMFWASEVWMLSIGTAKCGIKLMNLTPKDEHGTYYMPVEQDVLFKLRLGMGKDAIRFLGEEDGANVPLIGGTRKPSYGGNFTRQTTGTGSNGGSGVKNPFGFNGTGSVDQKKLPAPVQQGTSQNQAESGTTNSATADSKDSRPSRPTLTLAHDSKRNGSEQSSEQSETNEEYWKRIWGGSLDDDLGDDVFQAFNNRWYTENDFNMTEKRCVFCDTDISFDDALEGRIGKWLSETEMICKPCLHDVPELKQIAL